MASAAAAAAAAGAGGDGAHCPSCSRVFRAPVTLPCGDAVCKACADHVANCAMLVDADTAFAPQRRLAEAMAAAAKGGGEAKLDETQVCSARR